MICLAFLIAQDLVDGAGPPFCFTSAGENAVSLQTFCNPVHRVALQVFPVDSLYHFCLFWIDDKIIVGIKGNKGRRAEDGFGGIRTNVLKRNLQQTSVLI